MNNQQLEKVLKSARVPERSSEYWEQFADRIQLAIERHGKDDRTEGLPNPRTLAKSSGTERSRLTPNLAFGFAFACLALLLAFSFWHTQRPLLTSEQVAEAGKYFREIQGLFPRQLEVIAFDRAGAQLILSDRADIPVSPPLYLKVCTGNQCRSFVTFSGQQIRVNGEALQVLIDRQGGVMVVGQQWVWSSSAPGNKAGPYRIAARPLPTI